MNTSETIRFWGAMILSGLWAAVAELLSALNSPQKVGFAALMSIAWFVISLIPIIGTLLSRNRDHNA